MQLNGSLTQPEVDGDDLVGLAVDDHLHHLPFTLGEILDPGGELSLLLLDFE